MSNPNVAEENGVFTSFIDVGDMQSLGKLYDKYAAPVFGFIIRIVHDETLAESILSKVFLAARKQATAFNSSESGFFKCLLQFSRQMSIQALDARKQQNLSAPNDVYGANHTAFDLLYYKGLNYNEAAAVLHISVEEVKAEIRAAIKKLKTTQTL